MKGLVLLLVALYGSSAFAAKEVGNGGGAWVCREADGSIRWARLLDLYEAEHEFHLEPAKFHSELVWGMVAEAQKRLIEAMPELAGQIHPFIESMKKNDLTFVDDALRTIDDSFYRVHPQASECPGGKLSPAPEQVANYTNYGSIRVSNIFWNSPNFSLRDRAALLMHEAVYAFMRIVRGESNSINTRILVGYLFSEMSAENLRAQVYATAGLAPKPQPNKFLSLKINDANRFERHFLIGDFELGAKEITQYEWFTVMQTNPSSLGHASACPKEHIVIRGVEMCPNLPVDNISWNQLVIYVDGLNKISNDGHFYRIPTLAEWALAARLYPDLFSATNIEWVQFEAREGLVKVDLFPAVGAPQMLRVRSQNGAQRPNEIVVREIGDASFSNQSHITNSARLIRVR